MKALKNKSKTYLDNCTETNVPEKVTETQRHTDKNRDTETQKHTDNNKHRDTHTHTHTHTHRERERENRDIIHREQKNKKK